jgi:uncharacterized protein (DUF1697 family)
MTSYVALLRAVNVSGTGKLPMAELKRIGEECGFEDVRTFIASGNLLFTSRLSEAEVVARIEAKLEEFFGKRVPVFIRTASEMAAVSAANPFGDEAPNRVSTTFLAEAPPVDLLDRATGVQGERMALGKREIYISYGDGIADSKLKIPGARDGTGRNSNTVAKLAAMAAERA